MNATERKLVRLRQIADLRRAQRRIGLDRDVAGVRAGLEAELGETVSQRLAARFLDLSHTTLQRWAKAGDLPLVYSQRGRAEVPVAALLALHERVAVERASGQRRRRHLERVVREGRERAARITITGLGAGAEQGEDGHGRAERRALAYHRALAGRLDRQLADEALHRVWKWRQEGKLDPRYADEWEGLLHRPLAEVRRALASDDPRARDLRQSSPFAGMLSEPERRRILELVH